MKEKSDANAWMYVSILLGVLLVVSISANFLTYNAISKALSGGLAGTGGTGNQQAIVPTAVPSDAQAPSGPVKVDITGAYAKGPANAKITIVEYSDFQCPFCARANPTVASIQQKYGNDVRVIFKHFPLSFHPNAEPAAQASECAGEQGKFWEMHDKLFENQGSLSSDGYKKWAAEIGINAQQFASCIDSGKYKQKVATQMAQGQQDGVSGTPTFYINGIQLVGAQPQSEFEKIIDQQLKN